MTLQILPALKAGTLFEFLGLNSLFGILMTVFGLVCQTVSCVMSILMYRTLRSLLGLKPLARAINLKPELINTTRTRALPSGHIPLISLPDTAAAGTVEIV